MCLTDDAATSILNHMVKYPRVARAPASAAPPSPVFAALGDPTRSAIVGLLAEGDRTVSALANQFPISLQATLKHVAVLERAEVVTRVKSGRTVTVRLHPDGLTEAEEWLHRTRLFWANQLDRLATHFKENP
jgi:DNA-binding transcriptional ArsR family regulator